MALKAGRFVCVFIPMFLTLLTLVFLIMIGLSGTNIKNSYISNLYWMQIDARNVTSNPAFINNKPNNWTDPADKTAKGMIFIENFYTVSMWGYCAGSGANTTRHALAFGQTSAQTFDFCTSRKLQFAFDFKNIWGLSNANASKIFGNDFTLVSNAYINGSSKSISTLYILTTTALCIEIIVGVAGVFSRWGSVFATLSALVTNALLTAFAAVTAVAYGSLIKSSTLQLSKVGIVMTPGSTIWAYLGLALAASWSAGLFWAFSSCCCGAGERRQARPVNTKEVEEPYTYARVEEPYGAAETVTSARPQTSEAYRYGQ